MNETEIERLVVRIVGDMTPYQKTLDQASSSTGISVRAMLGSLAALTAGYLSASAIISNLKWGYELAKQAEQSQISFEVMLGSAEKAKAMVEEMRQFAAATPLTTPDIQQAAKTLLQFGVAGNNVMPILRTLGDVTGGDAVKFNQLSLAFGQMSATGRLMGQDLLQMINAGFNPLQQISKSTGRSMADLKADMEKGLISMPMVVKAFQDATSAGGQFDGMMQKQSQSISGLMSTLEDNFGMTMMQISQTLLEAFNFKGILAALIDFFGTFSDNYQENLTILTDWIMGKWTEVTQWIQQEFGFVIDFGRQMWEHMVTMTSVWFEKTIGFFSNFRENVSIIWTWLGQNWNHLLVDMINMLIVFGGNMIQNITTVIRTQYRLYAAFGGWVVGMFKRVFSFEVVDAILTGLIVAGEKIREWAAAAWESIKAIFTGNEAPGALDAFIEQAKTDFQNGMENANLLDTFKNIITDEAKNIKNPLEGFQSSIEEGPKLKLDNAGGLGLFPDFVWKQGDDAKKSFNTAITGLGDPVAKETKKAKEAMKQLDAVAFNSAESVARVMEFKMSRLGGIASKTAMSTSAVPVRSTPVASQLTQSRTGGGTGGNAIENYLRTIAANTTYLKEQQMNKGNTDDATIIEAANLEGLA